MRAMDTQSPTCSVLLECLQQGVLVSVNVVSFESVRNLRHSHSLTQSVTNSHSLTQSLTNSHSLTQSLTNTVSY